MPFWWSPECDVAFQKLKKALGKAAVLVDPCFKATFIVDIDDRAYYFGVVLAQACDGQEKWVT